MEFGVYEEPDGSEGGTGFGFERVGVDSMIAEGLGNSQQGPVEHRAGIEVALCGVAGDFGGVSILEGPGGRSAEYGDADEVFAIYDGDGTES